MPIRLNIVRQHQQVCERKSRCFWFWNSRFSWSESRRCQEFGGTKIWPTPQNFAETSATFSKLPIFLCTNNDVYSRFKALYSNLRYLDGRSYWYLITAMFISKNSMSINFLLWFSQSKNRLYAKQLKERLTQLESMIECFITFEKCKKFASSV